MVMHCIQPPAWQQALSGSGEMHRDRESTAKMCSYVGLQIDL